MSMFPENAPNAELVFFRSYSHNEKGKRETWRQVAERTVAGIKKLGKLTDEEANLILEQHYSFQCLASGRSLWTSGRQWIEQQVNFPGAYNCTSLQVNSLDTFGLLMDLAMMGCGTGAVLSHECISQLPTVRNTLDVESISEIGTCPPSERREKTKVELDPTSVSHLITIRVGDSRAGWVTAYQEFLKIAFDERFVQPSPIKVIVDLSSVRPAGEKLKGFGGISNPIKLPELFIKCAGILNEAVGRKLNSIECCLLIDEAAIVVVAGNIRRTAGIRQFSRDDIKGSEAKDNLWYQDENGNWKIDPKRDALRMSNHTRIFKSAPTLEECVAAVKKQHLSGEGAIQWAGEALARGNADLWNQLSRTEFLQACKIGESEAWLNKNVPGLTEEELKHRLGRIGLNPCVTGDTWVHTEFGARQVKDLIGRQYGTYVNGELFSTTSEGFFYTGDRPVFKLNTKEGYSLKLTGNHKVLKVTSQTQKSLCTEWVAAEDLKPGDRICLHNHRSIQTWGSDRENEDSWVLDPLKETILNSWVLGALIHEQSDTIATETRTIKTQEIEKANYNVYCRFLRDLFDCYATVTLFDEPNGVNICLDLPKDNPRGLEVVQRMLLRLGIFSVIHIEDQNLLITNDNLIQYLNLIGFKSPKKHETLVDSLKIATIDYVGKQTIDQLHNSENILKANYFGDEPFVATVESVAYWGVEPVYDCTVPGPSRFDANGIVAHNCGEISGADFLCNLSEIHLNRIDARNLEEQIDAFKAGALIVSAFLQHEFDHPKLQRSRELDPIVGVSFTGLFDFFVQGFGVDWLRWWQADRPNVYVINRIDPAIEAICAQFNVELDDYEQESGWNFGILYRDLERIFLENWREIVENTVRDYCEKHGLKRPNRCTTVQPSGCVTRDAVRVFDRGLLFADEHMEPGSGEWDLEVENLTVREGIPVLTGIANKQLDLIRITLENGRQLTMTPNHRLSVGGKWTYAEDMEIGQNLDIEIGHYNNAEEAFLEYIEPQTTGLGQSRVECCLPSRMSPELAYFIGCLFGNGCVSEYLHRIRFSHGSREILEKLSTIGLGLFGIKGRISSDSRGGRQELTFSNKQLYEWFVANDLHKAVKSNVLERIPQKLRMSSRRSLLAFFAGLIDTDGCIRAKGSLSIDSASEPFLRHLQQIGEAVGLSFSFFSNTEGQNFQEVKSMFGLCLSRMKSLPLALSLINQYSVKATSRPLEPSRRTFSFNPYKIARIERDIVDYTYDYAVEGENDDDSWYWQGAIKSHNTKSLLTGASPGWHPPKGSLFIRRITVGKNHPIALAAIDCGYSVVPAQSDKDENGRLLDDPFDERCTEWLIEVPTQTMWAMWPGVQDIDISKFSAAAQFDFYMQVQKFYTMHNTSATIEVREHETEDLAKRIYEAIQNDEGYVSAAILARFDEYETFPRMPFEPIARETYDRLCKEVEARRTCSDFYEAISKYTSSEEADGPAACDSDKCLMPNSTENGL